MPGPDDKVKGRFGGLGDPPYLCRAKTLAFRPLARGRELKLCFFRKNRSVRTPRGA